MLGLVPASWLVIPYVMTSQAFSGIAKDLTKMSSKSAVKLVVPEGDQGSLYRWVAVLTGSKNALKGVGFFLGAAMLTLAGFQTSMLILAGSVLITLIVVATLMHGAPRQTRRQGEVQADVLQQPGRERAGGRADLPVRLARRLVRRRPAGLPGDRAGLELSRDRRLPRHLGDRLRDRPGRRPPLHPRPRRQLRARGPHRDVARLRPRRLPGGVSRSRSPRESTRPP